MSASDRRVVYIVPWYPAISHTFVLREVQALRRLGRRRVDDVDPSPPRRGHARRGRPAGLRHHLLPLAAAHPRPRGRPLAGVAGPPRGLRFDAGGGAAGRPDRARGEGARPPVLLRGGGCLVACATIRGAPLARRIRRPGSRRCDAGGSARRRRLDVEPGRAWNRHAPDPPGQPRGQDPLGPVRHRLQRLRPQPADGARRPGALVQDPGGALRVDMAEYDGTPPTSAEPRRAAPHHGRTPGT